MLCRCHLLLLAALVTSASSHPPGPIRVCGYQLANEIAKVCEGRGYNDPFNQAPTTGGTGVLQKRSVETSAEFQGLANDCCYRSCTYAEMEQYCSPAPPTNRNSPSLPEDTKRGVQVTPSRSEQAAEAAERTAHTSTIAPPRFRLREVESYYAGFILPSRQEKS